jgi:hypothetical protein
MKYAIINAKEHTVTVGDYKDIGAAKKAAGLDGVDFGSLSRELAIVVYEFGLLDPPGSQYYFSIARGMFAGNAVLFRVDEAGETIDIQLTSNLLTQFKWYDQDVNKIERAIAEGDLIRPQRSINGEVTWSWNKQGPDPRTEDFADLDKVFGKKPK